MVAASAAFLSLRFLVNDSAVARQVRRMLSLSAAVFLLVGLVVETNLAAASSKPCNNSVPTLLSSVLPMCSRNVLSVEEWFRSSWSETAPRSDSSLVLCASFNCA
jgi:hypothetical protein